MLSKCSGSVCHSTQMDKLSISPTCDSPITTHTLITLMSPGRQHGLPNPSVPEDAALGCASGTGQTGADTLCQCQPRVEARAAPQAHWPPDYCSWNTCRLGGNVFFMNSLHRHHCWVIRECILAPWATTLHQIQPNAGQGDVLITSTQ